MTTTENISYNENPKDVIDEFIEIMYRRYLYPTPCRDAWCDEHADVVAELYGQFELLDNQTGLDVETVVKLVRERTESNSDARN